MMYRIKVVCVFLCFVVFGGMITAHTAQAQMAYPGEELEYEVSFLGIKLGTIKMITEATQTLNGKTVYKMKAYIDSRPGIPFVDLHSVYESWMDNSATYSHQFAANTKQSENSWMYDKYVFDYDHTVIQMEKFEDKKLKSKKSITTPKKWNDGCSLFFTARQLLFAKKSIKIPTVVQEDTVFTTIAFSGRMKIFPSMQSIIRSKRRTSTVKQIGRVFMELPGNSRDGSVPMTPACRLKLK